MPRPVQILRVFTRGGSGGNHLGVVNDVVGLGEAAMQAIATDLGFSETVFVDWFDYETSPVVRIFTPTAELGFAGHPLVGAAWVMARLGPGGGGRLRCEITEVSYRMDGEMVWVDIPSMGEVIPDPGIDAFLAAAGIDGVIRAWRVLLPTEYVIAELDGPEAVASASPDLDHLAARLGTYIVSFADGTARARFFAPGVGVPEDPATGSAAVALAAALCSEGIIDGELIIHQGEEMGHPSRIDLRWTPDRITIGGTVSRDEVRFLEV